MLNMIFCPRCGSASCNDPDSKECSDNCIMRKNKRIMELEAELREARDAIKYLQLFTDDLGHTPKAETTKLKATKMFWELEMGTSFSCDNPSPDLHGKWIKIGPTRAVRKPRDARTIPSKTAGPATTFYSDEPVTII